MAIIKDSISDQICDLIKNQIFVQELELGAQIDTKKIAEEHNISIMPVRDALNKLESQGLVIRKSRVGYFVRSFTAKEVKEIMEARKMYELYSLEEHFEAIDKAKLREILEEIINTESITRQQFDKLDDGLHNLIIAASGNDFLINNYSQINDQIILFRRLDKNRIQNATREHKELIEAILSNDLENSRNILKNHIDLVTESVLEDL